MKVGTVVKFVAPVNADEAAERMVVVDDRDSRVLVQHIGGFEDWSIKPQTVYAVAELVIAE